MKWGWEASFVRSFRPSGSFLPRNSTKPGIPESESAQSPSLSKTERPPLRKPFSTSQPKRAKQSLSLRWSRVWKRATNGWRRCWRRSLEETNDDRNHGRNQVSTHLAAKCCRTPHRIYRGGRAFARHRRNPAPPQGVSTLGRSDVRPGPESSGPVVSHRLRDIGQLHHRPVRAE